MPDSDEDSEISGEPYVNIEGPEFDRDYSYYNFTRCDKLYETLELGIPLVPANFKPAPIMPLGLVKKSSLS